MLLMGKSTVSMAIFNSYVKLPEGNKNFQKKTEVRGKKNGNIPQNTRKRKQEYPRIISFTYLMSFKLGSSMVPHGKQFSSTHCLGPIQGLIEKWQMHDPETNLVGG